MFIEVEENPNCETSVFLRFKELGPPRQITHVKIYDHVPQGEWCLISGWSDSQESSSCEAWAQPVEDSGAGIAVLVFGGNCGIRLKSEANQDPWDTKSDTQWGEAYLLLSTERDIRYL